MKQQVFLLLACALLLNTQRLFSQCISGFTYSTINDTVQFQNTSSNGDIHFYWNFGDGSTSSDSSPTHIYPENGKYLTTLYVLDTITQCQDYYEEWISVIAPSNDICEPNLDDTIITQGNDYIIVWENSTNCSQYSKNVDSGPAQNFPPGNYIYLGNWGDALFVSRIQYYTNDTVNGFALRREAYKTRPYKSFHSNGYDTCSANFEYHINYQTNGAEVSFHAMNPYAANYTWHLIGMGNPVVFTSRDFSFTYPYIVYEKFFPWMVTLYTIDSSGCTDTVTQTMMIRNINYETPADCRIEQVSPLTQYTTENNTARIIIHTDHRTIKQWYGNNGTGWIALNNAGPYSGTNSDTLTIYPASQLLHGMLFKCSVENNISGCSTSSQDISLIVTPPELVIYPNPTQGICTLLLPEPDTVSSYYLLDATGRVIDNREVTGVQYELDMGIYAPGFYQVILLTNRKKYLASLVRLSD